MTTLLFSASAPWGPRWRATSAARLSAPRLEPNAGEDARSARKARSRPRHRAPRPPGPTSSARCSPTPPPSRPPRRAPNGLVAGLGPAAVWLDFSTVTPVRLAALRRDGEDAGSRLLRRPGGRKRPAGDRRDADDPRRRRPGRPREGRAGPRRRVARRSLRFGDVGQGSAMKLVNNLLFGVGLAAFGEALALAKSPRPPGEEATRVAPLDPVRRARTSRRRWEFLAAEPASPSRSSLASWRRTFGSPSRARGGAALPAVVDAARGVFERARNAGFGGKDMSHVVIASRREARTRKRTLPGRPDESRRARRGGDA